MTVTGVARQPGRSEEPAGRAGGWCAGGRGSQSSSPDAPGPDGRKAGDREYEGAGDTLQEKRLASERGRPVPRTDTRGLGEKPEASETTVAKELCKTASQASEKKRPGANSPAGRSEEAGVTVYQKHSSVRSRKATYTG